MQGVEAEFSVFRTAHPNAIVVPIASTGGAALRIFREQERELQLSRKLLTDFAYPTVLREMLSISH
jgi:hypothetical protein